MYKQVLQSIDNIAIWPVISFVIFFTFFIVLLWWVFTADKTFIREMSEKPLHDSSQPNVNAESLT
ncbi:MAG: cbb3-type cytochrome c oxidase subunit 3 [Cyclobacteriaceae bacterium]|nr:cbb3-type cytochrome c oxidase subunit 3 [Cyclobacteriaceae bacterium]